MFLVTCYLLLITFLYPNDVINYRLVNSDHLQVNRISDEYVTFLRGNVHFFYNDIEFKSDRAEIYDKQKYVYLRGNVIVVQDTLSITCDEARYYQLTEYLRVEGRVVMTETKDKEIKRKVTSHNATHYRDKGEFVLQGNVFAHDISDSLFARSGYAFYNQQTGYGYLIQRPVVWRAGQDSLALYAEKIEFFQESNKVVASFNVITQNSFMKATCDFLIFYTQDEKIIYIGDPKFYSDNGDGEADLITVFLKDKAVDEIFLQGNSHIMFNAEGSTDKENWVKSVDMTLKYRDNRAEEFIATDDVKSFFKQEGSSKNLSMYNNVSGDKLYIIFDENNKIDILNINQRVQGKYKFERKK